MDIFDLPLRGLYFTATQPFWNEYSRLRREPQTYAIIGITQETLPLLTSIDSRFLFPYCGQKYVDPMLGARLQSGFGTCSRETLANMDFHILHGRFLRIRQILSLTCMADDVHSARILLDNGAK